MTRSVHTKDGDCDAETIEIVLRVLSSLDATPSEPANLAPESAAPKPPPAPVRDAPKYKHCGDCGELLEIKKAFMKDGRGGYRKECRMCFNIRYRNGGAGYKHRYSYKKRRA